jgi:hypothetical protein
MSGTSDRVTQGAAAGSLDDSVLESIPLDPTANVELSVCGFTELRCHGVSGPLPGTVLQFPEQMVIEVQGNAYSGFWRRWRLGGPGQDSSHDHLEAFCWGGLTSRAATQALWLALLPFSLVNLAHWMVLPYRKRPGVAAFTVIVLRVLALSFTLMLLLSGAEVCLDVGAWQCAARLSCRVRVLPLGLARLEGGDPGRHLATGAAALALVLALLFWLAGKAQDRPLPRDGHRPGLRSRLGPVRPPKPAVPLYGTSEIGPVGIKPVLGHRDFWADDRSSQWLRGLHTMAWCASLGAILSGILVESPHLGSPAALTGRVLLALNLAALAGVLFALVLPTRFGRGGTPAPGLVWLRLLVLAAGAALVASIVATWVLLPAPAKGDGAGTRLPLLQGVIGRLAVVQLIMLVLLAFCCGWLAAGARRARRAGAPAARAFAPGFRPMLFGMLPFSVSFLGWQLAMTASAGFGLLAARYFGVAVVKLVPAKSGPLQFLVPPIYQWTEAAALAALVGVSAVTLLVAVYIGLGPGRRIASDALKPKKSSYLAEVIRRAHAVARTTAFAQRIEWVTGILTVPALTTLALAAWAAYRWQAASNSQPWFPAKGWISHWPVAGAWITATGTGLLIALVYSAFRNQNVRRLIGILWDVSTFWPRANHPLTPACTAERSVPQLADRIRQLTRRPGDAVVLSGHSQGAILSAAAVLRLIHGTAPASVHLQRLALLTYGNPLRRLYARCFPAYFPQAVLEAVDQAVDGRWLNLWCRTDMIGSSLGDRPAPSAAPANSLEVVPAWRPASEPGLGQADVQMVPDPLTLGDDPRTGVRAPVCDHCGYIDRPEYPLAVEALRNCVRAPDAGSARSRPAGCALQLGGRFSHLSWRRVRRG